LSFSFIADCASLRAWLALNLVELGEFDPAIRVAEEAVEFTELTQHPYELLSRFAVSWVHLKRGQERSIIPELEEGLARCRARNPEYGNFVWRRARPGVHAGGALGGRRRPA
jgi:hypothetical protein